MRLKKSRLFKPLVFIGLLTFLVVCFIYYTNAENQLVFKSCSNNQMKIAITFDDGPHPVNSKKILDILDKYNVKSTFFVVGVNARNYPSALCEIAERGHEIGNHTYSHSILKSMSENSIEKEMDDTEDALYNICNLIPKLIRPPCGLYNDNLLRVAKKKNYKIVLWTIDTMDWAHNSVDNIVKETLGSVKSGDIILFHDYISGKNNTPQALDIIIPKLQEMGFNLVTVSELLQK